jgi:hypothetical protein
VIGGRDCKRRIDRYYPLSEIYKEKKVKVEELEWIRLNK